MLDPDVSHLAPTRPPVPVYRWVLAASLVALNLADVLITKAILGAGGVEANPIMASLMEHPTHPVVLKVTVSLVVGGLLLAAPPTSRLADRSVAAVVAAYVAILVWNVVVLAHA